MIDYKALVQDKDFLGMLDRISENANDQAPRLVLSDWFEEHGLLEIAKDIRNPPERWNMNWESMRFWCEFFCLAVPVKPIARGCFQGNVTITFEGKYSLPKFEPLPRRPDLDRDYPVLIFEHTETFLFQMTVHVAAGIPDGLIFDRGLEIGFKPMIKTLPIQWAVSVNKNYSVDNRRYAEWEGLVDKPDAKYPPSYLFEILKGPSLYEIP